MVATAWHLQFELNRGPIPEGVIQRAAAHDRGIIATGDIRNPPGNPDGTLDYSRHAALTDRFRAYNPQHRTDWFVGGVATVRTTDPLFSFLRNEHLLHAPDGRVLAGTTEADPGNVTKLVNLGDRAVQVAVIDEYLRLTEANGWHGLMVDNVGPDPYLDWTVSPQRFACPTGPAATRAWWEDAICSFVDRLRWRFANAGKRITGVGLSPGSPLSPALKQCTGVIFEFPHRIHSQPWYLEQTIAACREATGLHREVFWSCSPQLYRYFPGEPPPDTRNDSLLHRQAMTTAFLLVHEPPYTFVGYNPYGPYEAWSSPGEHYVHWEDHWRTVDALGSPRGPVQIRRTPSGSMYWRPFDMGTVAYNPGNTRVTVPLPSPARLWDRQAGPVVTPNADGLVEVEPYQGWVLWQA